MIPLNTTFLKHALPSLYRDILKGPHHSTFNTCPDDYLEYSLQVHQLIDHYREETGDLSIDEKIQQIKALHGKRHLTIYFDGGVVREEGVNKCVAHAFAIMEGEQVLAKHVFRGSLFVDDFANPAPSGTKMSTNVAEYIAMFAALQSLFECHEDFKQLDIDIYTDCLNVYNHLSNLTRSRSEQTLYLRNRGIFLLNQFRSYRLHNIPREENKYVDRMIREEFRRWREEEKKNEH